MSFQGTIRLINGVRFPFDRPSPDNIRRIDMGCLPMLQEMERNGMLVDQEHFANLLVRVRREKQEVSEAVRRTVGFDLNPGSHPQVRQLLFQDLMLEPPGRPVITPTGLLSTNDDVLATVSDQHPIVNLIRDYRGLDKLEGTYIVPIPAAALNFPDGRMRTRIKYTSTTTGRLSTGDADEGLRNLQNIPIRGEWGPEIRNGFVSAPGRKLVGLDLAQIEMVWAAHLSEDPNMMKVFHEALDIHTFTAVEMFRLDPRIYYPLAVKDKNSLPMTPEETRVWKHFKHFYRLPAKTLSFAILYGVTPDGLQLQVLAAGGPFWTIEECAQRIVDWFTVYRGVKTWLEKQFSRARIHHCVWTLFGRLRWVPECQSTLPRVRAQGERQAGNQPDQGSAADTIKIMIARLTPLVRLYQRYVTLLPLIQIHDELLFEADESAAEDFAGEAKEIMESTIRLSVPVRSSSDVGERWGKLK